ncbi:hypothetical protein D3C72_869230 [compost metagenome]
MVVIDFPFILIFVLNMIYSKGNTNKVKNVAESSPPITTVANGFCTSAPALCDIAIGKKPNEATVAVIKTGRSLIFVPSITRLITSSQPSFSSWLNVPISTIPFNTATPNNAIKPIPAEILKGIPRRINANTPPIALIGIAENIKLACFIELNVKYKSIKINNREIGTAIINRLDAFCKFSNVPP